MSSEKKKKIYIGVSSKIKESENQNFYHLDPKQKFQKVKKNRMASEDLKKEIKEAENFLEKANKDFLNIKKKENKESDSNMDSTIRFIEKTLEENKLKNNNFNSNSSKMSIQTFLNENNLNPSFAQIKTFNKDSINIIEDLNSCIMNKQNNEIIVNFDNNSLSNFKNDFNENKKIENLENSSLKEFLGENLLMNRYRKQLKSNGFPEFGNIFFREEKDQELLYKFFDHLLIKKSNENGDRLKLKKTCDDLREKLLTKQNDDIKMEKEILYLKEDLKKYQKENKILNDKYLLIKEIHEKSTNDLKMEINKYKNRLCVLQVDKKSLEEKYSKMSENYQKFYSKLNHKNPNVINFKVANIEISNIVNKNNLLKILSKINGTEKLIETIKNGYNESLREMLFEISALKNFILEINNEIIDIADKLNLKGFLFLENNFINMPFMDAISKIKHILRANIKKSFDNSNIEYPKNINNDLNFENHYKNYINNEINIEFKDNVSNFFDRNLNSKCLEIKNDFIIINNNTSDSINLLREKNDSLFENDKLESLKNKNNFNSSYSRNNPDSLFDQTNYENLIDIDLDNIDFDDSNNKSAKINNIMMKKISGAEKNVNQIDQENSLITNTIKNEVNLQNEQNNRINDELEFLKEKWMKALTG